MSSFTQSNPMLSQETLMLHHLVSKLENRLRPMASDRYTRIINEVPEKMLVSTNEGKLLMIMDKSLNTLVNGCYRDDIHITAKNFNNLVLIHMRNDHIINQEVLMEYLQPVNLIAAELGGCISISDLKGTTISITFLNKLKA